MNTYRKVRLFFGSFGLLLTSVIGCSSSDRNITGTPYLLNNGFISRSISFENPTGSPGTGATSGSNLGVGRKGMAFKKILPGESCQMCDIHGNGTIRRLWVTCRHDPVALRSFVVRVYYDGQDHPSIECPIGDLFGMAHGKVMPYCSAVHSVGAQAGMNLWLPMPFVKEARMTFSNESAQPTPLFYQVEYTLGDHHAADVGRLHVLFRRENPTRQGDDFELLPLRRQAGRYIGAVIGVRNLHPQQWWGEGEVKIYMDGDTKFPTIAGTGSEDYIGLSWGVQQTPFLYNGCSLDQNNFVSMYRWHLPDPIYWEKEGRVTIQQIACTDKGLAETSDDWSCATFWYEAVPDALLPPMPDVRARIANIWEPTPANK